MMNIPDKNPRAATGMAIGMIAGLFDALRAMAYFPGTVLDGFLALLVSCAVLGLVGAVAFPLADRLFGRPPSVPKSENRRIFSPKTGIVRFGLSLAAVSAIGLASSQIISRLWPEKTPLFRAGAAFMAAAVFFIAALRVLYRESGLARRGMIALAVSAGLVLGLILLVPGDIAGLIDVAKSPAPAAAAPRMVAAGPNILLIVLDTARADRMSLYGYSRDTTPFLSAWARESTVFDRAVSPAPWTLPSHASIFTGQYPAVHQATNEHPYMRAELVTLAEILADKGYATVGFSGNSTVGSAENMDQGFEHFYEVFQLPALRPVRHLALSWLLREISGSRPSGKTSASETGAFIRRWLGRWEKSPQVSRRPFFMFINYIDAHLPYVPPPDFRKKFLSSPLRPIVQRLCGRNWLREAFYRMGSPGTMAGEDYRQLADLYDGEIAFLDAELRGLLEDLRRRGLLDATCVAIVSDHGENLGEHGGLLDHCFSLHQTLLHVPLIIRYPPLFPKGLRLPALVSTTSLFRTILDEAGASPAPAWPPALGPLPRRPEESGLSMALSEYGIPAFELSLLAEEARGVDARRYAVGLTSIQTLGVKVVLRSDEQASFVDLLKDPAEETGIDAKTSEEGRRLLVELEKWRSSLTIPVFPPLKILSPLDQKTRQSLRALGYIK